MGDCHSCAGGCAQCSGCAGALTLTQEEIDMLYRFAQTPFFPVARKASDTVPVCLEDMDSNSSLVLTLLEKKGLIDIDYHMPLSGFDYNRYSAYPLRGSMALTARGQSVLEMLELQGAAEED